MPFTNGREWAAAVQQHGRLTRDAIKAATKACADEAAKSIKDRVPPGASDTSGMANPFPGYAATGALKGAINAGPVVVTGNSYRSVVAVRGGSKVMMYAAVHEYGKVITARRKPYLVFQINGQWIRTKQVRIKAKHFFAAGWNAATQRLSAILQRELAARL